MIDRLARFIPTSRMARRWWTPSLSRRKAVLSLGAFAGAALLVLSCRDFTGIPASIPTRADSGIVYAINGAAPGAPTAIHLFSGARLPADADFIFDLAFDIDAQGRPVILPMRAVATGLAPSHTVSLQTSTEPFDAILSAPRSGYHPDTAVTVALNQVVLVQSQDPNVCGISLTGSTISAKIVVRAVDPAARQLSIRYTVDPNCGFRSFEPGVPKD